MSDQNFNLKNFKPTLKPPSDMGKKIDTQFKNKMRNAGVNINMVKESKTMLNEKEESLKKKIFSLPKMETLVMTDDYLSGIYNKLKEDAQETYGYHWNETIMNIMFNEYVLDDSAYLQKYKNTKTYNKKRRGQEGVEELEKNLQDKIDTKTSDEKPEFDRDEKVSDIDTNKDKLDKFKQSVKKEKEPKEEEEFAVAEQMKKIMEDDSKLDELFGFGKPTEPLVTHKASKNDTYLVRKKDKTAVGVISPNIAPQQNQDTANKFADTIQYEKMPWYMAVKNGVKGVPTEVQDSQSGEFDALQQKYDGVPAMTENNNDTKMDETKEVKMTAGDGFELQFSKSTEADAKKAADIDSTYQNETTGAAGSSGQYTGPLSPSSKDEPIADTTYQNETTTSSSSGAFVGPFPKKRKGVLDKPLWVGGTIIKEGADYITNGDIFKNYVSLCENVDKLESMINESVDEGSGISIKQHAQNILSQLDRMKRENPDISQLPEFNDIIDIYTKRFQTGKVETEPEMAQQTPQVKSDSMHQWKITEHHLDTREDKINFIVQQKKGDINQLNSLNDDQIEQLYLAAEKSSGISETPDYENAMKIDLKNTGRNVPNGASRQELESTGGLFKGKWNENLNEMKSNKKINESMVDDQPDSMARTMDSPELNTSGTGGGASMAPSSSPMAENDFETGEVETAAQGDRQDKEAIADAAKFREFLMSKYGVSSVADMSPKQKQQVMKDLAANKAAATPEPTSTKPELNLKNFAATDAEKAAYNARDSKQLGFVASHDSEINSIQDFLALQKAYATEMGEKMFHPMALLASIKAMPPEEKVKYGNTERVLTSQMQSQGGVEESSINEERLTPSMLNLQNIKKETAKLTQKDMATADALKQAKVYPNPDEFYIEQDKIQEFQTSEELEKAALVRIDKIKALQNGGDSTNDNGKEIVKRNLTKDEMLRLAMNRGDGMHNIVYDNKPSDRFEKRLEKDMGEDQYKLRQEKMKYREEAPMYNKDTQPTETGDEKVQDDKYKVGFNEAFTAKYTDDYGRNKLVEFVLSNVKEVDSITEGYKLNLDGLGNKYTYKINKNEMFASDNINSYDFYLVENVVVKTKTKETTTNTLNEDAMNKMKHLMGYNARDFVNTKKSVKF